MNILRIIILIILIFQIILSLKKNKLLGLIFPIITLTIIVLASIIGRTTIYNITNGKEIYQYEDVDEYKDKRKELIQSNNTFKATVTDKNNALLLNTMLLMAKYILVIEVGIYFVCIIIRRKENL